MPYLLAFAFLVCCITVLFICQSVFLVHAVAIMLQIILLSEIS